MKLYGSSRSPFVRKVLIAAHETGTIGDIVMEPMVVTALKANQPLLDITPLGQIPTLVLDNGEPLYDSAVICRYLDLMLGNGQLHPRDIATEITLMRRVALGDGLTAALMSLLSEQSRRQPEQSEPRITAIKNKLPRIFASLDHEAFEMERAAFDMSQIAIVAGLCYVDFRLAAEVMWREEFPTLARWFAAVSQRPSVIATTYFDELSGGCPSQQGKARKA